MISILLAAQLLCSAAPLEAEEPRRRALTPAFAAPEEAPKTGKSLRPTLTRSEEDTRFMAAPPWITLAGGQVATLAGLVWFGTSMMRGFGAALAWPLYAVSGASLPGGGVEPGSIALMAGGVAAIIGGAIWLRLVSASGE
jgi:hypothetical protein